MSPRVTIELNPVGQLNIIALDLKPGEALDLLRMAFIKMSKQIVASHACGHPDCSRVEETLRYLSAIEAITYQAVNHSPDVNLKEVFMVAKTEGGGVDTISLFEMLKANRFEEIHDHWFKYHVYQILGIEEGSLVRTSQYQNMVRFLKKNGARLIDLEYVNAQKATCEDTK